MRARALIAILIAAAPAGVSAEVIYVNGAAGGANTGLSWTDAYVSLQPALQRAQAGDQIWVARGTYTPAGVNGNRSTSFVLRSGAAVYGGFAGTEATLGERNWTSNVTILSGDLNGNDLPNFVNTGENSLHVVFGSGVGAGTILDGFTVQGGNASDSNAQGGGIWLGSFSTPRITNCIIRANRSGGRGGGLFTTQSNPTVLNCSFLGNHATNDGGAICNFNGQGAFTNCLIQGNQAGFGGGILSRGAVTVTRCQIVENSGNGAGLFLLESSSTVTRCLIARNIADTGSVYMEGQSSRPQPWLVNCAIVQNTGNEAGVVCRYAEPRLTNCTIAFNAGATGWGGFLSQGNQFGPSFASIENCLVWGNTPTPQLGVLQSSTLTARYSDVQGGYAGAGVFASDPLFADAKAGNFRLLPTSACIDAGDNGVVPGDLSLDLGGQLRFMDDPGMPDRGLAGGIGGTAIIDVGAYEFQGATCYPNCDGSTAPPVLNVNDFICFQSRFSAGDLYANCDGSSISPQLNVNDFVCFLNRMVVGCP